MVFARRVEKIDYKGRPTDVIIYSATDALELTDGLKTLTDKRGRVREYDLFSGTFENDSWAGVTSKANAWDLLRHGTNNVKLVRDVKSYIDEVNGGIKIQKYREIDYRPFGCTPCIPRVLSGNPNCMILPKKTPVKSRILKVMVDCAVSCYFSADDMKRVGSTIARALCDIEQAGYRVRLYACDVTHNRSTPSKILCTHLMIKGENEPVNLQRILYPLAEVSFSRILGFTTINRADGWSNKYELYPILDQDNNPKDRKALYDSINGPDTIMLRMQRLGNELKKGDKEDVKKLVKEIFQSNDEIIKGGS